MEELLPGPVTLLLTRRADAPLAAELNPGVGAIGVRIPDSPFIRALCRQHRGALALTSANISGGLSSIAVDEFQVGGYAAGVDGCMLHLLGRLRREDSGSKRHSLDWGL